MLRSKLIEMCTGCIQFSRLSLITSNSFVMSIKESSSLTPFSRSFHSAKNPLNIFSSPVLNAEPLKKKKRIDPAVLRERAEKKIVRLNRDIRRLEKVAKRLKPISELEVPKKIFREQARVRSAPPLYNDEIYERVRLERQWANYRRHQHVAEVSAIKRIMATQEKTMDILKETSLELYEHALQVDEALIPFKMTGPVFTPPITDYEHPDGNFIDVTKKYLPIVAAEKKTKIRVKKTK